MAQVRYTEELLLHILYKNRITEDTHIKIERNFFLAENRRAKGVYYEEMAAEFLKKKGLRIMERNFRCRNGEIDLIARDGRYLVFIEVKYRKDRRSGSSFAAVGKQKQRTILKVALFYLIRNGFQDDIPCRFDVVGIDGEEIRWIKNAFEYRQR